MIFGIGIFSLALQGKVLLKRKQKAWVTYIIYLKFTNWIIDQILFNFLSVIFLILLEFLQIIIRSRFDKVWLQIFKGTI